MKNFISSLVIFLCLLTNTYTGYCQSLNVGMPSLTSDHSVVNKISPFLLSGINATLTTLNINNYNKTGKSRDNSGFGMITGLFQISYALLYYRSDDLYYNKKSFVLMNTGFGVAALLSGILGLMKKESKIKPSTSWNLYYAPTKNKYFQFGIIFIKKNKYLNLF